MARVTEPLTELFDCDRVNAYLDSYLLDQVPPPERRGMRLHIHRCPACFAKVTERDALQLFAPLADEESGADRWEGFNQAILEGIRRQPARRLARREGAQPAWGAGWTFSRAAGLVLGLAAAAAVAVGFVAPALFRGRAIEEPARTASLEPPAPPEASPRSTSVQPSSPGVPLPQTVEQIRTPDSRPVQVFSMQYRQEGAAESAEPQVTELVLIVDAGLPL